MQLAQRRRPKSLPACLSGVDVVTKARTGTGKTLAFLIPAIEQVICQEYHQKCNIVVAMLHALQFSENCSNLEGTILDS